MNRRQFSFMSAGAALSASGVGKTAGIGDGYFSLRFRGGSPGLVAPDGSSFFAIGLNRPPKAAAPTERERHEWERHYGRDAEVWHEAGEGSLLKDAGFNVSDSGDCGEGAAYCHLVPFNAAHLWNDRGRQCDYLSPEWDDWCDRLAKEHCAPRAGERNLVGYFYSESPSWRHGEPQSEWPVVRHDPDLLKSRAGRRMLRLMARRYYQVTRDAIRRYDPHHLILGDRHEAGAALPEEVCTEALPCVDVLSLQDFENPAANLRAWHDRTQMPVLLADSAPPMLHRDHGPDRVLGWFTALAARLHRLPGCLGLHLTSLDGRSLGQRRAVSS